MFDYTNQVLVPLAQGLITDACIVRSQWALFIETQAFQSLTTRAHIGRHIINIQTHVGGDLNLGSLHPLGPAGGKGGVTGWVGGGRTRQGIHIIRVIFRENQD
jgi:hypothetical protein